MSAGWTAGEMLPDWTPVGRHRANRERAGVYDLAGLRATVGWREAMAVRGES